MDLGDVALQQFNHRRDRVDEVMNKTTAVLDDTCGNLIQLAQRNPEDHQ